MAENLNTRDTGSPRTAARRFPGLLSLAGFDSPGSASLRAVTGESADVLACHVEPAPSGAVQLVRISEIKPSLGAADTEA